MSVVKVNRINLAVVVFWACGLSALTSCRTNEISDNHPIMLLSQGSFAIGGKTVSYGGEFDMANCYKPDGQTARRRMATMPMFSTRNP